MFGDLRYGCRQHILQALIIPPQRGADRVKQQRRRGRLQGRDDQAAADQTRQQRSSKVQQDCARRAEHHHHGRRQPQNLALFRYVAYGMALRHKFRHGGLKTRCGQRNEQRIKRIHRIVNAKNPVASDILQRYFLQSAQQLGQNRRQT
ncbi:hypothetical protein DJ90_6272 [Paenibacillus macerans]|uniref:Uncharacterized protein n=1 Tax=Paenibacillus macerans TaxID=44252 RepID=A0A090XTR5_PAEMA|nr:hypothetical protein DJ90_6272 [Paenibacillus macerans]